MNATPAEHLCSPPPPSSAALLQAQLTEGRRPAASLVLHADTLFENLSAFLECTATFGPQGQAHRKICNKLHKHEADGSSHMRQLYALHTDRATSAWTVTGA